MIADNFYIHSNDFNMFYTKKKKILWASHPRLHQGITMDPLVLTAPTRPPAEFVFSFVKNQCAHILSVLSPVYINIILVFKDLQN